MYVYGGRDETHIFADVFKFNLEQAFWQELHCQLVKPESPEYLSLIKSKLLKTDDFDVLPNLKLRFGHTACIYKHYMYVFGGWDGHRTLNDFAVLDL